MIASEDFRFSKKWGNFEEIPERKPFAYKNGRQLYAKKGTVIIFPKTNVVAGQQACLLAERVSSSRCLLTNT